MPLNQLRCFKLMSPTRTVPSTLPVHQRGAKGPSLSSTVVTTPLWSLMVRRFSRLLASQIFAERSKLPVINDLLSSEKVTAHTQSVCPFSTPFGFQVPTSHRRTTWSAPADANVVRQIGRAHV